MLHRWRSALRISRCVTWQTPMSRIILVRHGHVVGINPPRLRGRADLSLTDQGQQEAQAVADRISKTWAPALVYASPLRRCVDTGQAIADACGVRLEKKNELSDLDYGRWQGKTWDEARLADAELFDAWLASPDQVVFPGGESLHDVAARAAHALQQINSRHARDTIVVVSHDSVNRVILALCLNMPHSSYWRLVQAPCCINEIEYDDGRVRVHLVNDTSHLSHATASHE